tara:strand:+ start:724 stop:1557 length:834 start_codon:yes stop_codon:yes gene_type:complete
MKLERYNKSGRTGNVSESEILGVPIANLDYKGTVDKIVEWGENRENRYVCVSNVHSLTSSMWTPDLRDSLMHGDLNTADGVPLVWMQRMLGVSKASRVYGPTLMLHLLERCCRDGLKVAFYGGHSDRLPLLLENMKKRFPGLDIAEVISPPFRELTPSEDLEYTQRLSNSGAHVVLVGIGCPKQENWMRSHTHRIKGVLIGVGAAFDFHAGVVPQAPPRLQKVGLEWAYRLYCEPRRLFKWYITTNPVFVVMAALQIVSKLLFQRNYVRTPQTADVR